MSKPAQRLSELSGVTAGLALVLRSAWRQHADYLAKCVKGRQDLSKAVAAAEDQLSKCLAKSRPGSVSDGLSTMLRQTDQILRSDYVAKNMPNFFGPKRTLHWHSGNPNRTRLMQLGLTGQMRLMATDSAKPGAPTAEKAINLKEHKFEHKVSS